jgi:ferredoxin
MRITVDRDRCVGAGQCVLAADEVFDQREDDGCVELRMTAPPAQLIEAVREAEQICPSGAIEVEDA